MHAVLVFLLHVGEFDGVVLDGWGEVWEAVGDEFLFGELVGCC